MSVALDAMKFARQVHASQFRKYTGNPYVDHLAEVAGIDSDCRKYAEAQLIGWRVLRVTGSHVKSGEALKWVEGMLARCSV